MCITGALGETAIFGFGGQRVNVTEVCNIEFNNFSNPRLKVITSLP
jgi:hypothetical protein